jgi:hypothetical protein
MSVWVHSIRIDASIAGQRRSTQSATHRMRFDEFMMSSRSAANPPHDFHDRNKQIIIHDASNIFHKK